MRPTLANPHVNFAPYDNDGNGFVDAFIVVHAGRGAEETGNQNHIWSHKWVLTGSPLNADGTKIFGYLTIPEDSKIGVCAHELGHLLFGWPDLYDTDGSSEGLGNWCLMGGGSWNGNGDIPAHPSAWCKVEPGLGLGRQPHDERRGHDQGREERSQGVPPVEERRRRQGVFPAREPAAHALRPEAAGRGPARLPRRRGDRRRTRTRTTRSSSSWRPTVSTTCTTARTAAIRGTRIPGSRRTSTLTNTSNPNAKSYGGVEHVRDRHRTSARAGRA